MTQLCEGQPESSEAHPLPQQSKTIPNNSILTLKFLGRRGRWHTKGSKQAAKGLAKKELRSADEILQLRKKASRNRYRQMSKRDRSKRKQQKINTSSHQSKIRNKISKRRKR